MQVFSKPIFDSLHNAFIEAAIEFSAADMEGSLVSRFSAQVDRFPDKIAIQSAARSISFVEIDEIANRVANGILEYSANTDVPVALRFDDTALLVATIFGVLKSGRAYLVLEPDYPPNRIDLLMRDSTADILIWEGARNVPMSTPTNSRARAIPFEGLLERFDGFDPDVLIRPDAPALVMYTSGSTGQPLGVIHTHKSILSEVGDMISVMRIGHRDKWIQYASLGFASSIRSTFGALLTGATLVLYDIGRHGFSRLEDTITSRGITIYRSLPSTFRHFTAILQDQVQFSSVRIVSLGGETIAPTDIERFNRHFQPHCILVTSFGPTECLGACWGFVKHGTGCDGVRVPMGYERPGKTVSIVDERGNIVADGQLGEISVTGRQLSNGYWNSSQTTSRRFRRNADGSQTFLTGDMGLRDGYGLITHMGRRDFQIKIRGYRVDPFEIEEYLRQIEGVEDAVVLARPNQRGEPRLVACVVERSKHSKLPATIKRTLESHLPHYMIPDLVEVLDYFPLNSNGKIDRQALSTPACSKPGIEAPALPRTNSQQIIARIWEQVLGTTPVDAGHSFLELGGDSLKAAQVANYLSNRFGVEIPLWRLLTASNIEELDREIQALTVGASS